MIPTGRQIKNRHWITAVIGLLFAAHVFVIFAPSIPLLNSAVTGCEEKDVTCTIWLDWILTNKILRGELTSWSDYMDYPQGISIFDYYQFSANPFFLLGLFLGPVPAHNLMMMMTVFAAGFCGYLWSFHLTGLRFESVMAGLVFSYNHVLLFSIWWGQPDGAAIYLLPLFFLLLAKTVDSAKIRWAAGTGVFLAFIGYQNGYYMYLCLITLLIFTANRLTKIRREKKRVFRHLLLIALCVTVFIVLHLPRYLLFFPHKGLSLEFQNESDLPKTDGFPPGFDVGRNLDLSSILNPFHRTRNDLDDFSSEAAVYFGLLFLAVSLFGLRADIRLKRFWLWIAFFCFLISLGQYLSFGQKPIPVFEKWYLPGINAILNHVLPFFSLMNHPYRFIVGTCTCLAVFYAAGLKRIVQLTRTKSSFGRMGISATVTLLVILELKLVTPALFPVTTFSKKVPLLMNSLKDTGGEAVMILPQSQLPWSRSNAKVLDNYHLYSQAVVHGRKIARPEEPTVLKPLSDSQLQEKKKRFEKLGIRSVLFMPDFDSWTGPLSQYRDYPRDKLSGDSFRDNFQKLGWIVLEKEQVFLARIKE